MEKFTTLTGVAAPMDMINIDTDMVIPKQFLTTIERSGLGKGLFFEMRYDADGNDNPDFVLNKPAYKDTSIIIAGDIFDRAIPPPEAVELFGDFLAFTQRRGISCLVIPGNHDSAVRLGFAHEVMEHAGVYLRCDFSRLAEPVTLRDAAGLEVDVFMLPFVEIGPVRDALQDDKIRDHLVATERAIREQTEAFTRIR